jgi:hypothetical protein
MQQLTWIELNDQLRTLRTEAQVLELWQQEREARRPRKRWLARIWGRYKVLRNKREQRELGRLRNSPRTQKPQQESAA